MELEHTADQHGQSDLIQKPLWIHHSQGDLRKVLQRNAVAYVNLHDPIRGKGILYSIASPSLQQLATEVTKNYKFTCLGPEKCMESNASSIQMQGDSDYFINHLGVPALQFSYQDSTTLESKPVFKLSKELLI
ncbi:PREDICTED: inactive N-acetylated-alpha-linked acidic dipeptidase-like protein 2, partial [Thamnophis sirtalis]|uniref:Inactive N-acetylated-alpha-linked acidic dipeptidase-like protein 2 n=1 Tax=Thamnophis sirtalis TaxID=35019 RepID=A0A6I9X5S0_9SAUR